MFLGIVEGKTTHIHAQIMGLLFPFTAQLQKQKYGYGKIEKQKKNVEVTTQQALAAWGSPKLHEDGWGRALQDSHAWESLDMNGNGWEIKGMGA